MLPSKAARKTRVSRRHARKECRKSWHKRSWEFIKVHLLWVAGILSRTCLNVQMDAFWSFWISTYHPIVFVHNCGLGCGTMPQSGKWPFWTCYLHLGLTDKPPDWLGFFFFFFHFLHFLGKCKFLIAALNNLSKMITDSASGKLRSCHSRRCPIP